MCNGSHCSYEVFGGPRAGACNLPKGHKCPLDPLLCECGKEIDGDDGVEALLCEECLGVDELPNYE
jgi:hypothetical protein